MPKIKIRDNSYNRLVGTDDPDNSVWKTDSKSWKYLIGQELEIVSEPKTVQIELTFYRILTYQVIQVRDLDGLLHWVLYASLNENDTWKYLYPEQLKPEAPFESQIKIVL